MRIAYITAGAAGMYCGSCLHDNTLATALLDKDQKVALIPTYTPTRTDERNVSLARVFYGAVNVYLKSRYPLFRHAPRAIGWLLDRPGWLRWVTRFGSSTDGSTLGQLTTAMLQGEDGPLERELGDLSRWLRTSFRPDVVHITNSLLLGLAGPLERELGAPVVVGLQGEDIFLDELPESFRRSVLQEMRRRVRDAQAFVAPSSYYSSHMGSLLEIPEDRLSVVPLGIQVDGYPSPDRRKGGRVVGYLARICPEKGLHLLAESFRDLCTGGTAQEVRLRVAGYLGSRDRSYLREIEDRLRRWGLSSRVEYLGEVDRQEKLRFLSSIDVLALPTVYREAKGLPVLEALAAGVPVVVPRHGSFPELVSATGGGLLVEPGSRDQLTAALRSLLNDPDLRRRLGTQGREAVHRSFTAAAMADGMLRVYRRAVTDHGGDDHDQP